MYELLPQRASPASASPSDTEEQFIYKARKKALGAFKRELWELPEETPRPRSATRSRSSSPSSSASSP